MIIVGEKLNGMFSAVARALDTRDPAPIVKLSVDQTNAGAQILDVSVGPGRDDAVDAMKWMVRTIQDAVDTRLSIDSPSSEVLKAGLSECNRQAMVNSSTAEDAKLTELLPLAKEYSAEIVCLTIDEKGIPNSVEMRTELAMKILAFATDFELAVESVYIDPVVLPVSAAQNQLVLACEALSSFKTLSSPPPKTIVGLSNVSSGAQEKRLLNRTLLAMMMGRGLDAAIVDPLDVELMNTVKAAEILLNKRLYAHSFLKA